MNHTPDQPPADFTMPMGAWKRGYDMGQNTDIDATQWRDKCPYRRPSPEANAWTSGFIEGRATRPKVRREVAMSHYGISMVHINSESEVEEVKIHRILRGKPGDAPFGYDEGGAMSRHDVASLIMAGNSVWVLAGDGPGNFKPTDRIHKKPGGGQIEYIESCDADGNRTTSLIDLPKY